MNHQKKSQEYTDKDLESYIQSFFCVYFGMEFRAYNTDRHLSSQLKTAVMLYFTALDIFVYKFFLGEKNPMFIFNIEI